MRQMRNKQPDNDATIRNLGFYPVDSGESQKVFDCTVI